MEKKNNIFNNESGFTTVEILVVLIILTIVASIGIWGILSWVNSTTLRRQNEYAHELFMSAQRQLADYSEDGQLSELTEKLKGSSEDILLGEEDLLMLIEPDGKTLREHMGDYKGTLCHVTVSKMDYTRYRAGNLTSPSKLALYQILSDYENQKEVMEASISIEFSLEDGQVYSVLYSDKTEAFTYSSSARNAKSVLERDDKTLRKNKIGYYSAGKLTNDTASTQEKTPVIQLAMDTPKLHNEEVLSLTFSLKNHTELTDKVLYKVAVLSEKSKKELFRFWIDGSSLKSKMQASKEEPVKQNVEFLDEEEEVTEEKDMPIMAWIDEDETIRVILDAVDLNGKKEDSASFQRFGVEEENICVRVAATGKDYITSPEKTSNEVNVLFESDEIKDDKSHICKIKNLRHLYNIRYMEEKKSVLQKNVTCDYQLMNDMDWKEFFESGNVYEKGMPVSKEGVTPGFPGIVSLREGCRLIPANVAESQSDGKVIISHLVLKETVNIGAGLYKKEAVRKLTNNSEETPTALVLINQGSISDITLSDVTVEGRNDVGSFVGYQEMTAQLTDCAVAGGSITSEDGIAGGLIGENYGTAENITLTGATVTGNSSSGTVGGLIGANGGQMNLCTFFGSVAGIQNQYILGGITGQNNSGAQIYRCRNYGNSDNTRFGGVAGLNSGTIIDSFSFASGGDEYKLVNENSQGAWINDSFFLYYIRDGVNMSPNGTALYQLEPQAGVSTFTLQTESQRELINQYMTALKNSPALAVSAGSENLLRDNKTIRQIVAEELDAKVLEYYEKKVSEGQLRDDGRMPEELTTEATEETSEEMPEEETEATEEIPELYEETDETEAFEDVDEYENSIYDEGEVN